MRRDAAKSQILSIPRSKTELQFGPNFGSLETKYTLAMPSLRASVRTRCPRFRVDFLSPMIPALVPSHTASLCLNWSTGKLEDVKCRQNLEPTTTLAVAINVRESKHICLLDQTHKQHDIANCIILSQNTSESLVRNPEDANSYDHNLVYWFNDILDLDRLRSFVTLELSFVRQRI